MKPGLLHIFVARANPIRWQTPDRHFHDFADHMLESGVNLHVVECAYGDRPFVCEHKGVDHIGVRATTMVWTKENLLNIGIRRTPEAKYIGFFDADVFFRRPNWAEDTVHALQLYDIIQPWNVAYDLGPNDEHIATHRSFCSMRHAGQPLVPAGATPKFWKGDGGPYEYPHSGYAWSLTRSAFDKLGGLFEVGGMGSGDHHMALALVGEAEASMPSGTTDDYRRHVLRWQNRALQHINGRIGFIHGTIEHRFHGSKGKRNYLGRWDMFVQHGFSPDEDLKLNSYGVLELAGNKRDLALAFDNYLRSRCEDDNFVR